MATIRLSCDDTGEWAGSVEGVEEVKGDWLVWEAWMCMLKTTRSRTGLQHWPNTVVGVSDYSKEQNFGYITSDEDDNDNEECEVERNKNALFI